MTKTVMVSDKEKKRDEFKLEVIQTFATLITAAFGLVAALAWNEAIKSIIGVAFNNPVYAGIESAALAGLFVYAIIVTIIAVIFSIFIARSARKAKDRVASHHQ
ncbi:MAG TPA: DUF5654 family protein [Candidatus Methanomethylophilaceae archaeon]|nr:DUF5654 family protein [Candidatus Methanomethylophilaceae archaeon]